MSNTGINKAVYDKLESNFSDFIAEAEKALESGISAKDFLFEYAFKYNTYSNIITAKDDFQLTYNQCQALLKSDNPLERIYDEFMNYDCNADFIEELHDCIIKEADFQAEKFGFTDEIITAVFVASGKEPQMIEISSAYNELKNMVDGNIEVTYPFSDPIAVVRSRDGKADCLPLNRAIHGDDGFITDIIAGNFLIVGIDNEKFTSVSNELADKYTEMFRQPEIFMRYNGHLHAIKNDETDKAPVYLGSEKEARNACELDAYRTSFKSNMECKKAIEQAISDGYHDNTMKDVLTEPVIEKYGLERVKTILAITCIEKEWDNRISRSNKEWAKTVPIPNGSDGRGSDLNVYLVCERPHIGLVNIFIDKVRDYEAKQQEKSVNKKPSVLGKLEEVKGKISPAVSRVKKEEQSL